MQPATAPIQPATFRTGLKTTGWTLFGSLLLWLCMAGNAAWAQDSDCQIEQAKSLSDAHLRLFEIPPYKALVKNWSVSPQMKRYFDQQKQLLLDLQSLPVPEADQQVRIAAVGDLMRMPTRQDDFVSQDVLDILSQHEVIFGNLETLISERYPVEPDNLYKMNSTASIIRGFTQEDGSNLFSAVSLANNHVFDYPDDAISDTLDFLAQQNIAQSGIRRTGDEKTYALIEKNGIRIGFYALSTFYNNTDNAENTALLANPRLSGIEPIPANPWRPLCELDLDAVYQALDQMKNDRVDIKIISIHWGHEHDMYPQPLQLQIAHQLVRNGADIILGSHPHVPQPAEICFVNGYENQLPAPMADSQAENGCLLSSRDGVARKALIYYSLGNFTAYSLSFWQQLGIIAEFVVTKRNQQSADWSLPRYHYTYTHQYNPPNGARQLSGLDHYLQQHCLAEQCSGTFKKLRPLAGRHMTGSSLSLREELEAAWLSLNSALETLQGSLIDLFNYLF